MKIILSVKEISVFCNIFNAFLHTRSDQFFKNITTNYEELSELEKFKFKKLFPNKLIDGTYFDKDFELNTSNLKIKKIDDKIFIDCSTLLYSRLIELLLEIVSELEIPVSESIKKLRNVLVDNPVKVKYFCDLFTDLKDTYLNPCNNEINQELFTKQFQSEGQVYLVHTLDDACEICENIGYPCIFVSKDYTIELNSSMDFDQLLPRYSYTYFDGKIIKGNNENLFEWLDDK